MSYFNIKLTDLLNYLNRHGWMQTINQDFDDEIPEFCANDNNFGALRAYESVDDLMNQAFWTVGALTQHSISDSMFEHAMRNIDAALAERRTSIMKELGC